MERPLEPHWRHLGDHVDLLGRSVTLSWLSWHIFGHYFDSLDVQTKKFATILASHVRLLLLILHISFALVIRTISCSHVASTSCLHLAPLKRTSHLHWSCVPLMCISSAPFNLTSHVQLAFAPHILSFAPVICISDCTSYLHI